MQITYYGHSCFLVDFGGKKLLFDPFISGNPKVEGRISINEIQADYILLTHGHLDHVLDAEVIAQKTGAIIISNFEIAEWYAKKGITTMGLNQGGKTKLDFGSVKYVTAIHSSSLPDGSYGGNPGGFVIWGEESCFYHAGDTALTMDLKLIPMTCPKLDFAILPVGDYFTMGYEDAALAAEFIQCQDIVGGHFDTFPPVSIDRAAALEYFREKSLKLYLPQIGESFER